MRIVILLVIALPLLGQISDDGTNLNFPNNRNVKIGSTVISPTTGIKSPLLACAGTPGNTVGPYRSLCVTSAGAAYACANAAGCTVAGDWVAQGGGPWTRSGTTISPTNSGDSVSVGSVTPSGSGTITNVTTVAPPSAPTLSGAGSTGGSTTWGYKIVAGLIGSAPVALGTAPSAETQTAVGQAALDSTNKITVTPPACTGIITSYDVYRTTAGGTPNTTGLIGNVACGTAFNDTGLSIVVPFLSTPPDYSVGSGSSVPSVNTTSGSCFGSFCVANNDPFFPFYDSATGLAVLEHTANPNFDYNAFLVDVILDQAKNVQSATFDVEVNVPLNGGGNSFVQGSSSYINLSGGAEIVNSVANYYGAGSVKSGSTLTGLLVSYYGSNSFFGTATQSATYYANGPVVSGGGTTVTNLSGFYSVSPTTAGGSTITTFYHFYGSDLGSISGITNPYYEWFDSRGVYRIKEDNTFNSVGQAIAALYNPQFTKYTPGATDFERLIEGRWNSNVAEIGAESGGSGTLRDTRIIGAHVQINAGGAANTAACYKSDGKTLGVCASVVGAGGGCTCN